LVAEERKVVAEEEEEPYCTQGEELLARQRQQRGRTAQMWHLATVERTGSPEKDAGKDIQKFCNGHHSGKAFSGTEQSILCALGPRKGAVSDKIPS
jgi:hypothetical protein